MAGSVSSLIRLLVSCGAPKRRCFGAERESCPGVGILSDEHQRQGGHRVHICLHFLKRRANAPVAAPYARNDTFVEELK